MTKEQLPAPFIVRFIIHVALLILAVSPKAVKRIEPNDAALLFLCGLVALTCAVRPNAFASRLSLAGIAVFAYSLGRRAWIVERFVPTESAWQLLSFAGLFVLLLVVLWLPYGRALWRRDEHRDVLAIAAATSGALILLSLVMVAALIGKYAPPQFSPAQTLSVCAQSLEYLGLFAIAFYAPLEEREKRGLAAFMSAFLFAVVVWSLGKGGVE